MEYINQILCGDCIKILSKIPENSIDLIITSPPYNIGMKYDVYIDKIPWDQYYIWCEEWLYECLRVLKPDGRMALNHYLSFGNKKDGRTAPLMELNHIALNLGFKHHTVGVWTDATLSRRTAWGSWKSSSAPYIQCLLPDSDIITENGYKTINEITEGLLVRTHKSVFQKVNVVQKKLYSGDLIKIKSHYNISEEIGCTPEHGFYVRSRST